MSKKLKSTLFCVVMGICLIVSIMGWHWTDVANTPFWWNFWVVAAIGCAVAFIGGVLWYFNTKQDN